MRPQSLLPLVASLLLGGGAFTAYPAEASSASPLEQVAELRAIRARMSGQEVPADPALALAPSPDPAPVAEPASAPATEPVQALELTTAPPPSSKLGGEMTLADIRQDPPNSLPQQQAGEKWNPFRIHTEIRSRPDDRTIDAKVEVVTQNGWMTGAQFVTQSGSFTGENLNDIWKGTYADERFEFWVGRHWASQDGRTRGAVNAFVRQLTHKDSGSGQSLPGTEYPYSYTWRNAPTPLTQVGVRARGEHDIIRTASQKLTVHLEGEAAPTVSGQSGWAYDVQAGVWYRTDQVEAYGEVGVNNTGAYANGYGRYYLTKDGQLRLFGEVRGEVGDSYHNVQVGGGLQLGLGRNGYAEAVLGYNIGTSGDGLAATGRIGFKF